MSDPSTPTCNVAGLAAGHTPTLLCVSNFVAFEDGELGVWRQKKGEQCQRDLLVAVNCAGGHQSQRINTELHEICL